MFWCWRFWSLFSQDASFLEGFWEIIFNYLNLFFFFLFLLVQDNADRTSSFVVLINLLRPLEPSRWPSTGSKESFASRNQKFSDLVVKCLIKLTKVCLHCSHQFDYSFLYVSLSYHWQSFMKYLKFGPFLKLFLLSLPKEKGHPCIIRVCFSSFQLFQEGKERFL